MLECGVLTSREARKDTESVFNTAHSVSILAQAWFTYLYWNQAQKQQFLNGPSLYAA